MGVVWTGYDIPESISIGGNPAAQLWRKVMSKVHEGLPWKDFTWPYLGDNTGVFGLDEEDEEPGSAIIIDDDDGGITVDPGGDGGGDDGGDAVIVFG